MDERYPIGKFKLEEEVTPELIASWIEEIEALPKEVREAVENRDDDLLDTPYRAGGWTVRQVVHHLADSHMNAFIRIKLALTEEKPVVKTYEEAEWAMLPDYNMPVEVSLQILEALHARWVLVLRGLSPQVLEKTYIHPESGEIPVAINIGIYAWHGRHHLAHIRSVCLNREGA
jgi:DinB superfamily